MRSSCNTKRSIEKMLFVFIKHTISILMRVNTVFVPKYWRGLNIIQYTLSLNLMK